MGPAAGRLRGDAFEHGSVTDIGMRELLDDSRYIVSLVPQLEISRGIAAAYEYN